MIRECDAQRLQCENRLDWTGLAIQTVLNIKTLRRIKSFWSIALSALWSSSPVLSCLSRDEGRRRPETLVFHSIVSAVTARPGHEVSERVGLKRCMFLHWSASGTLLANKGAVGWGLVLASC